MTEAQLRSRIKTTIANWCKQHKVQYKLLDYSDRRRMPSGLKGVGDLQLLLPDTTLWIECKTTSGKLRPEQEEFWLSIYYLIGKHLRYIVASDPIQVKDELNRWAKGNIKN